MAESIPKTVYVVLETKSLIERKSKNERRYNMTSELPAIVTLDALTLQIAY